MATIKKNTKMLTWDLKKKELSVQPNPTTMITLNPNTILYHNPILGNSGFWVEVLDGPREGINFISSGVMASLRRHLKSLEKTQEYHTYKLNFN